MGGGEHFDDVSVYERRKLMVTTNTPRSLLVDIVVEKDLHRPAGRSY